MIQKTPCCSLLHFYYSVSFSLKVRDFFSPTGLNSCYAEHVSQIKETSFFVSMNSDQKIYGHIEQLTELLDRILIQKNEILNDEDKARIQKVYQLIDQSLLKELKECDFLKNIDVAELEK